MRGSGILMHITSLPGAYGVGTMGKHAYEFVDFLNKAGQCYWQMLPLSPTGYGDSPYQSCSAFAGNHYLIDLDLLAEEGLLCEDEFAGIQWSVQEDKVDFGLLYQNRLSVLRLAYNRFTQKEELDNFCRSNSSWLSDFALFMALKDENGGKPWHEWPDALKYRQPDAMWEVRQRLGEQIRFYSFVQFLFFKQWTKLLDYAHEKGIKVIGDVPIYVPLDSADVWSDPDLFLLDENLSPVAVAGCPPDTFSEDGQLWGNPLYRWDEMAKDGYRWWLRRLAAAGRLYDVVRLDHFRGFEAYWSVPYGHDTARHGQWIKGPGLAFVQAVKAGLPDTELIAEDLGFMTREVLELRKASGYPGMKLVQFGFDSDEQSEYLPHTYDHNTVCYTGTHDNMTTREWFDTANADVLEYAKTYMNLDKQDGYVWGMIRTAMSSVSDMCIVPMQDYLDLGAEARMNTPGTTGNNWTWRVADGCFTSELAEKIYRLTKCYGRLV